MEKKIRLREVILVEGKYDKIKLEALVDGLIIPTNGFRVFQDPQRVAMIRRLAAERGVLILTDSDGAGKVIRGYLNGILPPEQVRNAYVPDIFGKERRKAKPSAEGKLGVEGMKTEILRKAIERVCPAQQSEPKRCGRCITKADFYADGLSGGENSARLRTRLLRLLELPENLSANGLLQALNGFLSYEEYRETLAQLRRSRAEEGEVQDAGANSQK